MEYLVFSTLTSLENHVPRLSITTGIEPFYATISCTESVATRPIYFWVNAHTTFLPSMWRSRRERKHYCVFPSLVAKGKYLRAGYKMKPDYRRKISFPIFNTRLNYIPCPIINRRSRNAFNRLIGYGFRFFFNFFHSILNRPIDTISFFEFDEYTYTYILYENRLLDYVARLETWNFSIWWWIYLLYRIKHQDKWFFSYSYVMNIYKYLTIWIH